MAFQGIAILFEIVYLGVVLWFHAKTFFECVVCTIIAPFPCKT